MEIKNKGEKMRTALCFAGEMHWGKCPYCKNMIVWSNKETQKALRKWRKNKR